MKENHKGLCRLTAVLVCLCLLLGSLAPAALALDGDIHIGSAADWHRLVQNCRLDTWSQGKTVVLDCDLDLTGEKSIPTFGGTFDGQTWNRSYDADWVQEDGGDVAYRILAIPADSGDPLLGRAEVTVYTAEGDPLASLPVAWQEVTGHG